MPDFANLLRDPAFSLMSMTRAINIVPNQYGMVNDMNLFGLEPVSNNNIGIEFYEGMLNLVPSRPRGGTPTASKTGKRKIRTFPLFYYPLIDTITADELQSVRGFGGMAPATMTDLMLRKTMAMRAKFDQTREYIKCCALTGKIYDANGSDLLLNIYNEFGITRETVNFNLNVNSTNITSKCRELSRAIEDNLKGEVSTSIFALVSPEFFDGLINHPNVEKFYMNYVGALALIQNQASLRRFTMGDITFQEYRGRASYYDSETEATTTKLFIPEGDGIAFPVGTRDAFSEYCGPANRLDAVNMPGQMLYANQYPSEDGSAITIKMEMSNLALLKRPDLVYELKGE